jgi:hypothetical protein
MIITEVLQPRFHSWRILNEAAGEKNLHLEHIEDLVFNEGYTGAKRAFNYLEAVMDLLEGGNPEGKLTVKWDGRPAIICGIDPEDSQFFVGTKSVFATTNPKAAKTPAQVKEFYGDKPDLAEKLLLALKLFPKLGLGTVVQGDFLFGPGDLAEEEVAGEMCYTFTPNTITYAVPVNSDIGKRIAKAKVGIVFHTEYTGATLPEMSANFGYSVRGLTQSSDIWFDDATYKDVSGIATLTPQETASIKTVIDQGRATAEKAGSKMDAVLQAEFAKYIKPFINNNVRSGEQVGDPMSFLERFMEYYRDRMQKEIDKLKSGPDSPAAQKRIEKIQQQEEFLADNANTLLLTLATYRRIISAKLKLIQKLNAVDKIGTFVKTDTGYRVTNHEGFVAFGVEGGAVKLNDRMEFNALNFAADKSWKK